MKNLNIKQSVISELFNRRTLKDIIFISIGVFMETIGLKSFLLPNNFLEGGAIGTSLLTETVTGINFSIIIVVISIPFIILGIKQISYSFSIKAIISIIALSILVYIIDLPIVTNDKLLAAFFGGIFIGGGTGFAIRGGAVLDGSEILAITVSRKTSLTVGDFTIVFNVILFCIAGWLVGLETAMYSMLTYVVASKTIDFVINGIEEYIGVMIVSDHGNSIKDQIMYNMGRGVTVLESREGYGKGGNNKKEKIVLFCVVTRFEVSRLVTEVDKIDEKSFIVQYPIRDTKGGMIKKRSF